jgi:hypothetical protein
MIGKLFGTTNFGAFFKEVQDPISGIHTVLTATGQAWQDMISTRWADSIANALGAIRSTVEFISAHFKVIEIGLGGFLIASGLAKVGEVAKGLDEFFNIGRAVINVASGTVTGPGVAEGEAAAGALSPLGKLTLGAGMVAGQAAIAGTQRPMELAFLERLGASADNAAKFLDGTWAKISWLDDKFGGLGAAMDNKIQALSAQVVIDPPVKDGVEHKSCLVAGETITP